MSNKEIFRAELNAAFTDLYQNDPRYALAAQAYTPAQSAENMVNKLLTGEAIKEGDAVQRVIKKLKIKNTYKAIKEFLNQ